MWSHLDPYLYYLDTTVSSGAGQDQLQTRFGFREFWIQGGRFYLNGTPINLLATATWPPSDLQDTNQIRQILEEVKAGNNVGIRFHTQPWDEAWYNIADEIGLLVVEECAVWCDPAAYKLSDATFWTNYSQHVTAAVKRDRNHPSIVLWSLENEILIAAGKTLYSGTVADLAALGAMVKSLDPTRPITYEADLDPGGEADVLGLHYPHEFPDYHVWPNDAYWMNQPIARDWMPGGQWIWDRSKPLYIGEFLWVPGTSAGGFHDSLWRRRLFRSGPLSQPVQGPDLADANPGLPRLRRQRHFTLDGIRGSQRYVGRVRSASRIQIISTRCKRPPTSPTVCLWTNTTRVSSRAKPCNARCTSTTTPWPPATLRSVWKAGAGAWQTTTFSLPPAGQWQGNISFQVPATDRTVPAAIRIG